MPQFDAKDGGLNAIHPAVPSDHSVMVFPRLAMIAQDADFFGEQIVVRHDRAGFAEGA